MKLFLDNKPFHFSEDDLPCLVSYANGTGGSHFSVVLVADLFLSGSKILFLTAYPMATDNFLNQVEGSGLNIARIENEGDLVGKENTQAIMIKSGDEELFMKVAELLPDIKERVVFVKNIEGLKGETLKKCLEFDKVILSGDIDKCDLKEEILKRHFKTTILFNQPETDLTLKVPELEKYSGYMWGDEIEGIVRAENG